jgi:hypothetical protein
MICILCSSESTLKCFEDKSRAYFCCQNCSLIFVPRDSLLDPLEEKKRYDNHQNSDQDPRYRDYLTKTIVEIVPFLGTGAKGLDFGCGSSHLMEKIFFERGYKVDSYDLYYHPNEEIWQRKYDFIVLSEVIEHLAKPKETMEQLRSLLSPGGQIFIKTKYYPESLASFGSWFYKNDPTHIQFFNQQAMGSLARMLQLNGPESLPCQDLVRLWD